VFICAGEKKRLKAALAVVPCQGIGQQGRVEMPQVGTGIDVVDGCRNVESASGHTCINGIAYSQVQCGAAFGAAYLSAQESISPMHNALH